MEVEFSLGQLFEDDIVKEMRQNAWPTDITLRRGRLSGD
jgi:hypothetical protein